MDSSSAKAVRGQPFARGNSGRPPGAKNKSTVVLEAMLDGEAAELLRKGIELAKAGEPTMLKFFLGRLLPSDRRIKVDLPDLKTFKDVVEAQAEVVRAFSQGEIPAPEAALLSSLIGSFAAAYDDLEWIRQNDEKQSGPVLSE
jgi:hypothetical protein